MVGINPESFWLGCPAFADEFVRHQPAHGLETSRVVICIDEIVEMSAQFIMRLVVQALDGDVFDGAVHSLKLAVGPGMLDLGQTVLDAVLSTTHVEHMDYVGRRWPAGIAWWESELNAVVGQDDLDFVGYGGNQRLQEGRCRTAAVSADKLDEGEFRRLR